jgi:hypothetical protein
VSRLARILLLAAVTLSAAAPPASAVPTKKLEGTLGELWTKVLQTTSAQNSFGDGGAAFACWNLGGTVAPLDDLSTGVKSCTVKPGTKIFVAASTQECSPFVPEDHMSSGTTVDALRDCARDRDVKVAPTVTVDGRSVPVTEVVTRPLNIVLPEENVFGVPAGTQGVSVAHGWVTLLHPLTPGKHTIVIRNGARPTITTTIIVEPGH